MCKFLHFLLRDITFFTKVSVACFGWDEDVGDTDTGCLWLRRVLIVVVVEP